MSDAVKRCSKCDTVKEPSDFHRDKSTRDGLTHWCKRCKCEASGQYQRDNKAKVNAYRRTYWAERKDELRGKYLATTYGLTPEAYGEMLAAQDGKCAICQGEDPGRGHQNFVVDHDHDCCPGRRTCGHCVRGLLCHECNTILGLAEDDSVRLRRAVDYIERSAA